MRALMAVLVLLSAASCARVMAPPGGVPDTEPPRIIETEPELNALAEAFTNSERPVRIIFDESISERSPREMVLVSPETGTVHVDRDGNVLEVSIEGGWRAGLVYHVTVLPGLLDRRGNARTTAYELIFSTGPPILPTAVAGLVTDRITGRPVNAARMEAISAADSTVYTTVTDSGGFFAFRSLPLGAYQTRVYSDQNRNRMLDESEARAVSSINLESVGDTVSTVLQLLAPDTTAGRLLRADIRDTLQVRLTFDDYMESTGALPPMSVTVWQLPDSIMMTNGQIMTPRAYAARRAAADTTAADTALTRLRPGLLPPAPGDSVLPINELIWVPPAPLVPGARYRVMVTGYRNINGIPDGGGNVLTTAPERPRAAPPPEAAPPDTTGQ